jgi:N-carbamoylputrescine amidase
MANRAGQEGDLDFLGRSMVISPQGDVLATLGDQPNEVLAHELEKQAVTRARSLFPFLRDRRPETYDLIDLPHAAFSERQPS